MDALEPELTEEEAQIARRGRNTKSTVPKSASVRESVRARPLRPLWAICISWTGKTGSRP